MENICNLTTDIHSSIQIDCIVFQKMKFIYNAINDGWTVHKKQDKYIFTKKHEGKKEIFLDNYLKEFIESNIKI